MAIIFEIDEPSMLTWKQQPPGVDANVPIPQTISNLIQTVLESVPRDLYSFRCDHLSGFCIGLEPKLTKRIKSYLEMIK